MVETSRFSRDGPVPMPCHDVLEVNEYLKCGLIDSNIEKWFTGPLPRFSTEEIAVPRVENLQTAVEKMRTVMKTPSAFTWPPVRWAGTRAN